MSSIETTVRKLITLPLEQRIVGIPTIPLGWDCGLQRQWGSNEILKRPHYMWAPTTWCRVWGSWKCVGCIIRLLLNANVQGAELQLMNLESWVWYCPTYCLDVNLNLKVDSVSYCWLQVRFSKAPSLLTRTLWMALLGAQLEWCWVFSSHKQGFMLHTAWKIHWEKKCSVWCLNSVKFLSFLRAVSFFYQEQPCMWDAKIRYWQCLLLFASA